MFVLHSYKALNSYLPLVCSLTTPHLCSLRPLLSCPCLQDSLIFPACINTSEWLSLLRWGTWLTSCIFPSISPSPSMCLSCSALNLCLHHVTLFFPSPILSSGYQSTFWPFWCFFLCTDKLICFLPLALREWKLMGCLYTGSQLLATSIIFSFPPVYVLLTVNGLFSVWSTFLLASTTLLPQDYFLNYVKLCIYSFIKKKTVCPFLLSHMHIFFYHAPNRGKSL